MTEKIKRWHFSGPTFLHRALSLLFAPRRRFSLVVYNDLSSEWLIRLRGGSGRVEQGGGAAGGWYCHITLSQLLWQRKVICVLPLTSVSQWETLQGSLSSMSSHPFAFRSYPPSTGQRFPADDVTRLRPRLWLEYGVEEVGGILGHTDDFNHCLFSTKHNCQATFPWVLVDLEFCLWTVLPRLSELPLSTGGTGLASCLQLAQLLAGKCSDCIPGLLSSEMNTAAVEEQNNVTDWETLPRRGGAHCNTKLKWGMCDLYARMRLS